MKYLYLLIIPALVFGQASVDRMTPTTDSHFSENIEIAEGCVLAIKGTSVNFEEDWMKVAPEGITVISSEGRSISFEKLQAPFWAEISSYYKGKCSYITSLRVLKQYKYDDEGGVISY
jgi:hypothetical protein